jgi:hypothetical protein
MIQKTRRAVRYGRCVMTSGDEAVEGSDSGLGFTAPEDGGPAHVPGGDVGPRAEALVFVLDACRLAGFVVGARDGCGVWAWNAGLLVGRRTQSRASSGWPRQRPL